MRFQWRSSDTETTLEAVLPPFVGGLSPEIGLRIMRPTLQRHAIALALALPFLLLSTQDAEAQRRGKKAKQEAKVTAEITVGFTLTVAVREHIREYYTANPRPELDALPPGIRKRLAKGKPLPPGIAKKVAPKELRSKVEAPDGYELVEVGLDVLLVEVATGIIHDILMDVIR